MARRSILSRVRRSLNHAPETPRARREVRRRHGLALPVMVDRMVLADRKARAFLTWLDTQDIPADDAAWSRVANDAWEAGVRLRHLLE